MTNIIGTGSFVPLEVDDNYFIEKYGNKAVAVSKMLHHHKHYLSTDIHSGQIRYTNTEMGTCAARKAIEMAQIDADEIDMIIYSTATPDCIVPPCFTQVQKKLKIQTCMGFDIRSGCAGFGTALTIADTYIAAGRAKKVLVIGADLLSSRFTQLPVQKYKVKQVFNHMFFGDSAGAVILSESNDEGFIYSEMASDRANIERGSDIVIGGSDYPYPTEKVDEEIWPIHQANNLSEKNLSEVLIQTLENMVNKTGVILSDIDAFIMPIESKKIKNMVLSKFPDIRESQIYSGEENGALINGSIPLTLDKLVRKGQIKGGSKIVIYAAENTQWQHAIIYMKWKR